MAIVKCKMCGGDMTSVEGHSLVTCEYCGTQQTLPKIDDEQRAAAFNRGNHFRRIGEFDKALAVYERIVREDDTDAEAHWCCALCRFGIEYVEDPATYEYLPTCHRASFDSFLDDVDYLAAVEHSAGITKRQYQKDGAKIAEVQRGILATSQNTEPYDVFICYKESDEQGNRTRDSLMAQDIYYQLTEQGRKVFFSRITLEDVAGAQYEPYIFAALNSARVMIVVGTKAEHMNAVWVKNEWSRFLAMIKKDRHKLLLPCYRDMDPYDMPEALSVLQSYDMAKIGFIQDLTRGIAKVLDAEKKPEPLKETVVVQQAAPTAGNRAALVKRAAIFLEDGNVESANDYCERALDLDPECAEIYVIKLLIDLGLNYREELNNYAVPFDKNANYRKAVRFGDDALRTELNCYLENIRRRNEHARIDNIYTSAVAKMATVTTEHAFLQLAQQLESIADYRDAGALAEQCREKAEYARKDAILAEGRTFMYKQMVSVSDFKAAIQEFKKIPGWKDAYILIITCEKKINELNAKAEADRLEKKRLAEIARKEAERIAKRKKKIASITSSAIAVCIVLISLWTTIFSPMLQYNEAQTLFESGGYDEAIAIFTELGDYKDSPAKLLEAKYTKAESLFENKDYDASITIFTELADYNDSAERVKEVKYSKAISLSESKDYAQAVDLYKELGEYKDCETLYPAAVLNYATALVEKNNLSAAERQLYILTNYDTYAESSDALFIRIMDSYYADGKYEEALSAYRRTKDYSNDSEKYKDMTYKHAQSLFDEKNYSKAKAWFMNVSGYADADEMSIECDYQQGLFELSKRNHSAAIAAFERVKDYKDSKEQLIEAKYRYVKVNYSRADLVTYNYLKELKAVKYKDSADLFEKLYAWKVELECANTDVDNYDDIDSSIRCDVSYFHYGFRLSGGEPGEKATFYASTKFPGGSFQKAGWYWENETNGGFLGCEWGEGFSSRSGTMTVRIYNKATGELVGSFEMEIKG